MQLSIKRSQRDGGVFANRVIFALNAQIRLTAEEQALIRRHKLGRQVVYASQAARREEAFGEAAEQSGGFGGFASALVSVALASLHLHCTIDSLTQGQRVECEDLTELLAAEEAFVQACKNTKLFLDTAASFDGREVVLDF